MPTAESPAWRQKSLYIQLTLAIIAIGLGWIVFSNSWQYIYLNLGSLHLAQASIATTEIDRIQSAEQSEFYLSHFVQTFPAQNYAWRLLGFARAIQGDESQAIEAWANADHIVEEFIQRAQMAYRMEDYPQTVIWYERALMLEPQNYTVKTSLARAYIQLQEYSKAVEYLESNLGVKTDDIDLYALLCNTYRSLNQPAEAIYLYQKTSTQIQKTYPLLMCIGKAYWDLQQYSEAIYYLELTVEKIPQDASAHNWLSLAYNRQGMVQEAIAESELAISLAKNNFAYLNHLVNMYIATEQLSKAQNVVQDFLKQNPGHRQAYALLETIRGNLSH